MSAWALTSLWRADELANGACENLATWRIVSAAALARSLLEGALAFVAESAQMASAWSEMKASGPPEIFEAHELRKTLGDLLLQAQFGSRIGEPPLRRPLIMNPMTPRAKERGLDLEALKTDYHWLCDAAVHPSYGFQTALTIMMAGHTSGMQTVAALGRGTRLDSIPSRHGTLRRPSNGTRRDSRARGTRGRLAPFRVDGRRLRLDDWG